MNTRIPEHIIEEIRSRNDIVEVVSQYVPLKKKGRNYFGNCPFHTEKTPSFSVNQEKQIFHCFGCGIGGSVFRFLMELEKISFVEAARSLAQRSGIRLPETRADVEKASANEELYHACEFARDYFHYLLTRDQRGEPATTYLKHRDIHETTIRRFKLGYAIPGWDHLLNAAAKKSLSQKALEKAGLVIARKDGGYYDRFRDRVIFPIAGTSGRTVAFGGRALTAEVDPKYLNSPETPIYHKGAILYGLAQARDAIRKAGYAVLVEGYMDALRLFQTGIENAVASAGTALTDDHARALSRYTPKVILVYDADTAGASASLRGIDILTEANLDTEVVALPEGHDPDSFVQQEGPDAFRRLLDDALPMLDYKLKVLAASESLEKVEGKRRVIVGLAESLAKVKDDVQRNQLITDLADKLAVNEDIVRQAVQSIKKGRPPSSADTSTPKQVPIEAPAGVERELVRLMLGHPAVVEKVRKQMDSADFTYDSYRKIAETIFQACDEVRTPQPALIMDRCEGLLAGLVSELAAEEPDDEELDEKQIDEVLEDHILRMKWDRVDRQIQEVHLKLRQAQQVGDQAAIADLLALSHTLNMQKRALGEIQKNA